MAFSVYGAPEAGCSQDPAIQNLLLKIHAP